MWSGFVFDLKKLLWQDELNPRVRCAFGNVYKKGCIVLPYSRVTSIKPSKRHRVIQWVTDKGSQWLDSGPIKNCLVNGSFSAKGFFITSTWLGIIWTQWHLNRFKLKSNNATKYVSTVSCWCTRSFLQVRSLIVVLLFWEQLEEKIFGVMLEPSTFTWRTDERPPCSCEPSLLDVLGSLCLLCFALAPEVDNYNSDNGNN